MHENNIINCLPESLREDEVPSTVYLLSNTTRIINFNYKETVKNIGTMEPVLFCNCSNSKYLNHHHGHFTTGDLRIIEYKELRKIISKRPNYGEPKTVIWKKVQKTS